MYELTNNEVVQVSGGEYQDWQVVAISGIASGLAFAGIKAFQSWSVLTAGKYFVACSVPTAIASSLIVGGMHLLSWIQSPTESVPESTGETTLS
ncbi:hypothetical protein CC99x_007725 [Candidatus Berkiella cookevillensis]|uniref:Uncharacterized protein n=1 Tax=Candidatus Berkiella cookevillensis TaxID=437022 RepID=A0A0Q9YMK6_9GAMM|nr:hypothetical protein [Candidatus Berkiella cookevillensis]MCS5708792.1 hypothetical protein [Candidatus Berkiella cookevillensis]